MNLCRSSRVYIAFYKPWDIIPVFPGGAHPIRSDSWLYPVPHTLGGFSWSDVLALLSAAWELSGLCLVLQVPMAAGFSRGVEMQR